MCVAGDYKLKRVGQGPCSGRPNLSTKKQCGLTIDTGRMFCIMGAQVDVLARRTCLTLLHLAHPLPHRHILSSRTTPVTWHLRLVKHNQLQMNLVHTPPHRLR